MARHGLPSPPHQFGDLFPDHLRRALIPFGILVVLGLIALLGGGENGDSGTGADRGPAAGPVTVEVDRVVDGDTAKVFFGGKQ